MAEQEIAKHGKQVIRLLASKEHSIGHKVREVAVEFATILFAVLLSIWLHGWSEHRHQQHEVRTFLAGLKKDLGSDIGTLDEMGKWYRGFDANLQYLVALQPGTAPDWKKFEDAYQLSDANWFFVPNKSRYDGFLMSGKLTNIEDPELLNGILTLYQSMLTQIQNSEGGWQTRQRKLREYRDEALDGDDAASHFRILTAPKGKRLLNQLITHQLVYDRHRQFADQGAKIVRMIDAYPGMNEGAGH